MLGKKDNTDQLFHSWQMLYCQHEMYALMCSRKVKLAIRLKTFFMLISAENEIYPAQFFLYGPD